MLGRPRRVIAATPGALLPLAVAPSSSEGEHGVHNRPNLGPNRRTNHLRRWVCLAGIVAGVAQLGCGWSYANQLERDAKTRESAPAPVRTIRPPAPVITAPAAATPTPAVTPTHQSIQVGARTLSGLDHNHEASGSARLPRDMRLHAFRLQRVDAFNMVDRYVHCSSGEVIEAKRRDSSMTMLAAMTAQGVPPGIWILRVDPEGQRLDLANNDWYRHIAKFHRLEYIGRDQESGLVTYRYLGPQ